MCELCMSNLLHSNLYVQLLPTLLTIGEEVLTDGSLFREIFIIYVFIYLKIGSSMGRS